MRRDQRVAGLVNRAMETCAAMGKVLQGTLTGLADQPPRTAAEARDLVALIVAYQRALQSVLDFEKSLDAQKAGRVDEADELDLGAARQEVLGKLARFADRG